LTHDTASATTVFVHERRLRPIGAIDALASVCARILPRALTRRVDQLRHDARSIADDLTGARAPSYADPATPMFVPAPLDSIDPIEHVVPRAVRRFVAREKKRIAEPVVRARRAMPIAPRELAIERVIRETPDAITIVLRETSGAKLAFEAGQFLSLHLPIDGRIVRRAYSLSSSPLDGPHAAITVKKIGLASSWLHENARAGGTIRALGPSGRFLLPKGEAHLELVAGGSGITPIASLLETALRARPELTVRLLYGARSPEDAIFADRLEALRASYPDRFSIDLAFGPVLDVSAGLADRDPRALYYLCGPAPMMEAARRVLRERGVPGDRVFEERFASPSEIEAEPTRGTIAIARRGTNASVRASEGQTILEAALAAGVALPFSCAMGGCGACKAKLTEGRVRHAEPHCLSDGEREAGYILTCSARPLGDIRVEVER
jgi:ring-1,2-phenylacetyl-CoA epoxidase subunit PaaE